MAFFRPGTPPVRHPRPGRSSACSARRSCHRGAVERPAGHPAGGTVHRRHQAGHGPGLAHVLEEPGRLGSRDNRAVGPPRGLHGRAAAVAGSATVQRAGSLHLRVRGRSSPSRPGHPRSRARARSQGDPRSARDVARMQGGMRAGICLALARSSRHGRASTCRAARRGRDRSSAEEAPRGRPVSRFHGVSPGRCPPSSRIRPRPEGRLQRGLLPRFQRRAGGLGEPGCPCQRRRAEPDPGQAPGSRRASASGCWACSRSRRAT